MGVCQGAGLRHREHRLRLLRTGHNDRSTSQDSASTLDAPDQGRGTRTAPRSHSDHRICGRSRTRRLGFWTETKGTGHRSCRAAGRVVGSNVVRLPRRPFRANQRVGDYTLGWITSALQRSAAPLSGSRALQAEHLRLGSDPHLRYSPGSARHCGLGGPNTTKARASSSGIIQPGRRPRQRMLRRLRTSGQPGPEAVSLSGYPREIPFARCR